MLLNRSEKHKNVAKKNRSNFSGVPTHEPINTNTLELGTSPRINNMKRKQLNPSLNHVGFVQMNQVSEEEVDHTKDNFTIKEAMISPSKT